MEPWYSKDKTKQKANNPKLQTTATTTTNPTPFLHLFPLPSISLLGGKEERNKIKKAMTFINLAEISSSFNSFLDHTDTLFIHFALNNGG